MHLHHYLLTTTTYNTLENNIPLTEKEKEAAETRQRILDQSEKMFMKLGIRSITMDDLARNLGISKKTIYQYFKDKDDLVHQMCENHFACEKEEWEKLEAASPNALVQLVLIVKYFLKEASQVNPSLLYDLQKYHPKSWALLNDTKRFDERAAIERLLIRGISDGLFRPEINTKILSQYRMISVYAGFDHNSFSPAEFNPIEVQIALLDVFVRSILNKKGMEEWEKMEGDIFKIFNNAIASLSSFNHLNRIAFNQ
jgi:AcrR family transcriptional regulator